MYQTRTRRPSTQAAYQRDLTEQMNEKVAERKSQQGNMGLLERFQALSDLIGSNGFLFVARWIVAISDQPKTTTQTK